MWLDSYEHDIEFNLAASTGPVWNADELLAIAGDEERRHYLDHQLVYGRPAGSNGLREAIAEMQGVSVDAVQIVTGASEALLILMWLAKEPGVNVILPQPGFPTFSALPESLGLEIRFYQIRKENGFRIDIDEIKRLADSRTKLVLVNSPHNPTGATMSDTEMETLHEFTSAHGMQLVSDEVYHPVYHEVESQSAARLPYATVIHDFSKAFPFPGIRTGWIIEHDPRRRQQYWNARAYFSISNNNAGEILAEIAIRKREIVLRRTRDAATRNLQQLDSFMAEHSEMLGWLRPRGGMTAFPWLLSGETSRAFCQAAAERGILLAPGDCFDAPSHFRLGFAASGEQFSRALDRLSAIARAWISRTAIA